MNIAAEELGRDILGKPVNPQNLVQGFDARYCCTTICERRRRKQNDKKKEELVIHFSPSTTIPTILFWVKTCRLFSQIWFSFAVDFLSFSF